MSGGDDQPLNAPAAREAEEGTAEQGELTRMKETFAQIASARSLFGTVPNGDAAAAALESAAMSMLNELENTGRTVMDISRSSGQGAVLADETDAAANQALARGQEGALTDFHREMERNNPSTPPGIEIR